jgi:hypothetical protein
MITKLFDAVFGCWHSHYSFPITARRGTKRNQAVSMMGTYVVCLDCGKELPYDWKQMRIVEPSEMARTRVAALAAKEAA